MSESNETPKKPSQSGDQPEPKPTPIAAGDGSAPAPDTPKKPGKRKKQPIDFDQLSERQSAQIQRIAVVGAKIGLQQQADQEAARRAMSANLHKRLDLEDDGFAEWVFARLFETATAAEAKKMTRHALCPDDLTAQFAR
jgi:hypothetical protein